MSMSVSTPFVRPVPSTMTENHSMHLDLPAPASVILRVGRVPVVDRDDMVQRDRLPVPAAGGLHPEHAIAGHVVDAGAPVAEEVDGFEVLSQVQTHAAGSYLPVLVLTADTTTAARNRALSLGAQDFLTKPLDITETCLRIANLLQTRELYSTLRTSVLRQAQRPSSSSTSP